MPNISLEKIVSGWFFWKKRGGKRGEQEDEALRYCPSCDTEYRPEVSACAHCNIALVSAAERAAVKRAASVERSERSMLIGPDDTLVPLRQGSLQEMKAIQYLLRQEHIPSLLSGDEMSCRSCVPQLTLEIKEVDYTAAQKVLAEEFIQSTGISAHELAAADTVLDMQAEEVVCPACRACFSPDSGICPDCGLNFL